MATSRPLPSRRNPLLEPEHTPPLTVLVDRRRLGQTDLSVRAGQVGTSNATKVENLGIFDYAHLRAPLPKDLSGSGIFSASKSVPIPDSYFLMRRSSDGFVSATGMFKAAFPWAAKAEEETEREYIKSMPSTDPQEVAGNIWIPAEHALDLADEYSIKPWIEALLDEEDVHLSSAGDGSKSIATPPRFVMPAKRQAKDAGSMSTRSTRNMSRELRSASPSKSSAPPAPGANRPKATPRKPRAKKTPESKSTKQAKDLDAHEIGDSDDQAEQNNQESNAIHEDEEPEVEAEDEEQPKAKRSRSSKKEKAEETEEVEAQAGPEQGGAPNDEEPAEPLPENTVRVSIHSDVRDDGKTETTHTTVKVEMPTDAPDMKMPTDATEMIEKAREMVKTAQALQETNGESHTGATTLSKQNRKRKAEELELDDVEEVVEVIAPEDDDSALERPVKRQRVMVPAVEYRREKVQKRALLGLSATFALGMMIPFFANLY